MRNFKLFLSTLLIMVVATSTTCAQKRLMSNKTYPIKSFTSVETDVVANVIYTQSSNVSVRAEGDKDMLDNLEITEKNGELKITHNKKIRIKNKKNLTIYISSPTIIELDIEGVGNWNMKGRVKADNLKIEFDGVGNFEALDLESKNTRVSYQGVGNLTLGGTTDFLELNAEGVGSINAQSMKARKAVVKSSGVGSVKCYASENIDLNNNGVGSITYYGNPKTKNLNNSGVGKIKEGK
ncbi:MAG: head GIN domain-containing protein [Candidatus Saccharimonadaceae bacterium]